MILSPQLTESIAFLNFCHDRSIPHRLCDFFDELVARYVASPEDFDSDTLFTPFRIQEVAEEIIHMVPGVGTGCMLTRIIIHCANNVSLLCFYHNYYSSPLYPASPVLS